MIEWVMMMADIETRLTVRVQPNAVRNMLLALNDGVLRVKIKAPPVEGKANRELVDFLSGVLGIRKSDIRIEKGLVGRNKVITIFGLEHARLMKMLAGLLTHKT
jgi:uncharacterized protein (TIGR00251 family)